MRQIKLILNNTPIDTKINPGITALDFIRYQRNLKGTKAGCREGDCGACTILSGEYKNGTVVYKSVASCLLPAKELDKRHIITIEGISGKNMNPLQQIIVEEGATQCGFCTPGFILSFMAFLMNSITINPENAVKFIDGNICRCTGYMSIKRVAERLCRNYAGILNDSKDRISAMIKLELLPQYFQNIPEYFKHYILNTVQKNDNFTFENMTNPDQVYINCAGGTDLYVQKPDKMEEFNINFLYDDLKLQETYEDKNFIYIGSCANIEDIRSNNLLKPILKNYIDLISSTQIRNRATLGGNIVNASPIGDFSIILLAMNAEMKISNHKYSRIIYLKDFYKGYKIMDISPGEIIEWFGIPRLNEHTYFNFEKISKRIHLDIASVNSAIRLELSDDIINDIHISLGGVAPTPLYLNNTSEFLKSKSLNYENLKEALKILMVEISPIGDVRGSKEYKTELAKRLFFVHFIKLFPDKFILEKFYE
jgi:xanthine dehydrogenase small subunit